MAPASPPAESGDPANQPRHGDEMAANEEHTRKSETSSTLVSKKSSPTKTDSSSSESISTIGHASVRLSDFVNDNLITARYVGAASIGLLAAYGIMHTPLFFRYRTVSELPNNYFRSRRTIRCRLVRVVNDSSSLLDSSSADGVGPASQAVAAQTNPILCQVRHLSPFEYFLSFLNKSWYERFLKLHPAAVLSGTRPDESSRELITVQIAGIGEYKPSSRNNNNPGKSTVWLQRLLNDRTVIKCQLLAKRRVGALEKSTAGRTTFLRDTPVIVPSKTTKKRSLQDMRNTNVRSSQSTIMKDEWERLDNTQQDSQTQFQNEIAIGKLYYRPNWLQLFATDMGQYMVRYGHAWTLPDGLYWKDPNDEIVHASDSVAHLRKDANYLESLQQLEYQAAAGSYGIWGDPWVRQLRSDIVEEVEFQENAPFWRKVWRWFRGG